AGVAVAQHGNRAVSSACGSADVLEALGFSLEQGPERIARSIDELGFGLLFAPSHHPAMRHAAPVRTELATRTVFNILGPLTNPAGARAQVVGVYSPTLVRTIAEVLARLGATRAFVVHGAGGIDELSPVGTNLVAEVVDGVVHERELDPEAELGLPRCSVEELRGGAPVENAQAIRDVFAGADGGRRSAVLLNSAGAGAAAVSILVDERFGGSLDDLKAARAATSAPLLAKGFFTEELDLLKLKLAGADAALILLRDVDDARAASLVSYARELGIETLVEAHDANELQRAVALESEVVGVNARDLTTFEIDRPAQLELIARLRHHEVVIVAESGVH